MNEDGFGDEAILRVPRIITCGPWEWGGERVDGEVQGPSHDRVVIKAHKVGNCDRTVTNTCGFKQVFKTTIETKYTARMSNK